MSLSTQIQSLVDRIAGQFNSVSAIVGNLTALTTTAKSSLVAAINELAEGQASAGAQIDDDAASLTTVYSSNKTESVVNQAISDLVSGAPEALDTLAEIAAKLAEDDNALEALLTSVGVRVRFDEAQVLTAPQQLTARTNIGAVAAADVGDTARDFVADFNAALTS